MDDLSLYPDQYHTGTARILPRCRTFNRAAAATEFLDAALAWAIQQTSWLLLLGGGDVELAAAHARMQRAGAVLEWEIQREAQDAAFPGPVYDDETIAALLAGARG